MLEAILNKGLMILFILSILNTLRHGYYFIQAMLSATEDEEPKKYILSKKSLILLGLSVAYILSAIFTGITI